MTTQNTSSINSRSGVISRRIPAAALAIALGAGVVAVPQFTEAAPVAHAQEAQAESQFSPDAVKFDGILDKSGNAVHGTAMSKSYAGNHPGEQGTVINNDGSYAFNFSIDVTDAQGGDRVYIKPTTRYTLKFGDKAGSESTSTWVGTRVVGNVPNRPLMMNDVEIGTVDTIHGNGIRVTFNENVNDMKSGIAKVAATAHSWDAYETSGIDAKRADNSGPLSIVSEVYHADANGKFPAKPAAVEETPTDIVTKFSSYMQSSGAFRNRVYTNSGAVSVTPKGMGTLRDVFYEAPFGSDYDVTLTPKEGSEDAASWLLAKNVDYDVTMWNYDEEGNTLDSVKGKQKVAEKFPDLKIDVTREGAGIHIKTTGVPEGWQTVIRVKTNDGSPLGTASYQPNAKFDFESNYTPINDVAKNSRDTVGRTLGRIAPVAGMPESTGTKYTRTAEVTPMVAGFAKGVGTTGEPAPVAGTKQTFEFEVRNTGDTYMAAPEVTTPDGEKKIVEGVTIAPGETGVVQVPYDVPADATRLDFSVDFPRYTLNAKNHTFRIGPVDHSEEERQKALDDINKNLEDQEKKLNELKDQLAKNNDLTKEQTDAIKDQTKALEDAIDEQKNAIDRLKDAVEKGDKTIADKIEKQTKAINDQTKAINDSLDSLEKTIKDGNEAQLAESKKQTQALKDNTAALREQTKEITESLDSIDGKLADQNEELKKQTAKLQKQVDALNKQAGELEKIKSELAKANELSEEMNNKLQLQIDESKKQTEALNGLIKSNNEQTAMLDKQLGELNETQKLQLKESIKQSIDLSRIADALERRNQILIDQHKDQLKQWDIENGFAQDEQNDRKHSMNLKRCMATDPGTPLLFLIPAGLALMFNMPGMQPLVKSASDQIASLNHDIQKATGINNMLPADLQKNINNFNKQYGDVARAGGAGMAGLIGAVVSAIAISNLVNNCYADADKSVGRETPEPVKLSDSAFSSRK